jgi:predicted DNA-binding transcriptional regulator YafY
MGEKRTLRLRYRNENEEESERVVRPLGAFYWGKIWTLAAWCELRNDFRNFRLDRIAELAPTDERFEDEPDVVCAITCAR